MEVPVGFLSKLWSFSSFLPFFFMLLILGVLKALVIGPIVLAIILVGNSSVIIGLWPAHVVWTYYCMARTKRIGIILKIVALFSLPIPLIFWPVFGIVGSVLGGAGYGFFTPLLATFEAVGANVREKCFHCFIDGSFSTIKGSCTVVVDFTDFCFHSYFSYMDELREMVSADANPIEVKLSKLPICLLVSWIGAPLDLLLFTAVALWKSPYMLFRGWKRLLEDLIGREGPFLESVCVPFAGLAIILWPLAVVSGVLASMISGFFLGLYGGVIVHQEDSFQMGIAYIISIVSLYDEYVNDLLYLQEGTCLPRPRYRRNKGYGPERKILGEIENPNLRNRRESSIGSRLVSEQSRNLRLAIQHYKPVQVWDWLFRSCEVNGRILLRDGLIQIKDIEECLVKGNSKKLSILLPAWTILHCLIASAKTNLSGLVISDEVELTNTNRPKDKVFEWFIGPLLVMKEQIRSLKLDESEELCLRKLVMVCQNQKPGDWDGVGFPSQDAVRRAQLQAIIRRLKGIIASMSRMPTFRRRLRNLVKVLYIEVVPTDALGNRVGGILKPRHSTDGSSESQDNVQKSETTKLSRDEGTGVEDLDVV